jgi:IS5 family transposase
MQHMKQTILGLGNSTKRTRKREFLVQMERVVPWAALVGLVAPFAPEGRRGSPPFSVDTMLRIHFMQRWFAPSDPTMEELLHDVPLFREFADLGGSSDRLPNEETSLRFCHLLEKHKLAEQILAIVNDMLIGKGILLKAGAVVDAALIAAPSSTKNAKHQGAHKRDDAKPCVRWNIAMRLAKRATLEKTKPINPLIHQLERLKASIRAKVEHPFRVIKRQLGRVEVRYYRLNKNTAQLSTPFALSNLWMVRKTLQVLDKQIRAQLATAA